jgi:EAL domain-containing protein (putative c-di-GMP-specific phosphodiesterase class I)
MSKRHRPRDDRLVILQLPRPFARVAIDRGAEPPRYRALRRRSLRSTVTTGAWLVAGISVLSAGQFAFRASPAAASLIGIDVLQALFAFGIVVAMRTRLRRYPAAVAFAFLAVVPVVPLTTLHLQPESVVLVASSLALVPIGVALFISWTETLYLLWAGTYVCLLLGSAMIQSDRLSADEHWETVAAVVIGLSFGIVGQRRRRRDDRLAYDRARELARILQESTAAQANDRAIAKIARRRVEATLHDVSFAPSFQPIVDLRTGRVVGHEALTRFADGTPPDLMFELASTAGLGLDLEAATIRAAIRASACLPPGTFLGLNASPDLIEGFELRGLLQDTDRSIVLEITEHTVIEDYDKVRWQVASLGANVTLAVDDAGAGYASLRHILELAPSKVKVDIGLVRGIDSDPARQALIAGLGFFALKRDIQLVAEGIETAAELTTLRSLGVHEGQGYLLGRPLPGLEPRAWPSKVDLAALCGTPRRRRPAAA